MKGHRFGTVWRGPVSPRWSGYREKMTMSLDSMEMSEISNVHALVSRK